MEKSWTEHFLEGFNAFFSAKYAYECPYVPASKAGEDWYDGYAYGASEQYFANGKQFSLKQS